jgi:Zn-dependent protease
MDFLAFIVGLLVAVTIHECSHAFVAYKLGDNTAKMAGRVSLNPLRHLDPIGTIAIFLFHIGWGKPVPVNERNFKHPIRDTALTSLAGPASNILTALIIALPLKYLSFLEDINFLNLAMPFLSNIFNISIFLGIFNLLPLPPLDGSKIIGILIPYKYQYQYQKFLENGVIYVIIFILFDNYILNQYFGFSFINKIVYFGYDLLTSLIFSST